LSVNNIFAHNHQHFAISMFFILSKLLFYFVMPLTWILAFLVYALFTKTEKRRKRSLIIATILLLFFTNPFIVNEAWLLWEAPPTPYSKVQQYDAAIILTGITNTDKSPKDRVYTNKGADRVLQPLRLFKDGHVKKIIISGGSGSLTTKQNSEAAELKSILVCSGIPGSDILLEEKSRNTHENALFTKTLLQKHPEYKKLLLVTSAFHMSRASGCFKKEGINADTFSVDFYTSDRRFYPVDLIVPQEYSLYLWQKLFHEVLGYIVYDLVGYC
jgi:uncharacterized SAM-binding protein YcdF (DUF218 family)